MSQGTFGHPIYIETLLDDSVLEFDLYLVHESRFVPYLHKDKTFNAEHRQRLSSSGVEVLYIGADDARIYNQYLEKNAPALLGSSLNSARKASIVYSAAKSVLASLFDQTPPAFGWEVRCNNIAEQLVGYVVDNQDALFQLNAVMSQIYYFGTHCINVSILATALAHHMGVTDKNTLTDLAIGGLIHDAGKCKIDSAIINKKEALTKEEMEQLHGHVMEGENLLKSIGRFPALSMEVVSLHHERIDGSGYPRKLAGEQIHLFGRIAAVVDSFDAMTTTRLFKDAQGAFSSIKEMMQECHGQYDPSVMSALVIMLRKFA